MPAPIPALLLAHIRQETTTLAICVKVTRVDVVVLGFTALDRPIVVDGQAYEPLSGLTPSTLSFESGTKAGGMEAVLFLSQQGLAATQVLGRLYAGAQVEVFMVNYLDLGAGRWVMLRGQLGEAQLDGHTMRQEVTPLIKLAQTQVGRLASASCQVREFGDSQCGVNLAPLTFTAAVSTVASRRIFSCSGLIGRTERFASGLATMLTGAAQGESRRIKAFTAASGQVELLEQFRGQIAPGDQVRVAAGCDRLLATCKAYGNVARFRGTPYIPGADAVLKVPE